MFRLWIDQINQFYSMRSFFGGNKSRKFLHSFLFHFIVISLLVLFLPSTSHALVVSPARIELEVDPGGVVRGEISLVNDKDKTETFYSSIQNFESGDESGVPKFTNDKDGMVEWLEVQKEIALEPGKRVKVPFVVKVPKDVGAGGYFSAIFWGNQLPRTEEGLVSLGAKVGSLVFLKIRGEIVEKGEIVDFGTLSNKKVFNQLPVDFFFRFQNSGNDRLKPLGEIKIYNQFDKEVDSLSVNVSQGSVLPNSRRKFFVSWGRNELDNTWQLDFEKGNFPDEKKPFFQKVKEQAKDFHLGKYTAFLEINYGSEKKQEAKAKISFYLFPKELLIITFVALLLMLISFKLVLKGYQRRIIKKYNLSQKKEKENE